MDAIDVAETNDLSEGKSGGALQNACEKIALEALQAASIVTSQEEGRSTVELLLGKVAKYESDVRLLSEQLTAQKQLCIDQDKSLQAFHLRLRQLKIGINTEINKLRSREQFLFYKEHELNRIIEIILKYISGLKGAGGGAMKEEGALATTEAALLEIMSNLSGSSSSIKDAKSAALNDALNNLLEGDTVACPGDVDDLGGSKMEAAVIPHPSSQPPPLPPKSAIGVPPKGATPHASPSLSMPPIPPRLKKAKSRGRRKMSSSGNNAHSSSDSDFEHFVPPGSRNSTRENSVDPSDAPDTSSSSSSRTPSSHPPGGPAQPPGCPAQPPGCPSHPRKAEGVKKSNSDPKQNKVSKTLNRCSPKKLQSNRSMSLSALEKSNTGAVAGGGGGGGGGEDSDETSGGIAESTGYSTPFDHLSNWKQMMLEDEAASGGQEHKSSLSLSLSLGNAQTTSSAAVHAKCDPKGQGGPRWVGSPLNRHSATEALLHRKDSTRSMVSRKDSTNSFDQGMMETLHRESSTADGYVTAAEIAIAIVGARRGKPLLAATPTESSSDYLPIIPSTGVVLNPEVQSGGCGVETNTGQREGSLHVPEPGAREYSKRGLAGTMGRTSGGSGTPRREQVPRDLYLKMVKSDSNTSLLDSDAHSIGPMPLYTKRSSAKGIQLVSLVKRTKSERISKLNVDSPKRRHSASIDVEYQIPPDAEEGYVEENRQKASIPLKFSNSITFSTPGKEIEACEKSGHLQKYDMKQRRVAKRWFVLRGSELKYYRAKETFFGIGGPRGVIDLGGWCRLSRCVRPTAFQLDTPQKTYHLVADNIKECEEWLKAIQIAMQSATSFMPEKDNQCALSGWAEVAYNGSRRKLWCSVEEKVLRFAQTPDAKSLREINLEHVNIKFDESHQDENSELVDGAGTIFIAPKDLSSEPTRISVGSTEERNLWMFNLTKSSEGPVLTLTEKLIMQAKLGEASTNILWSHPVMIHTGSPIVKPLTTLPSPLLFFKVKNIFQSIQLFMGTPVNPSALDYHIHAVQHITKAGIRYPALQNEIYCLILQQMFGQDNIGLRGWLLLFLLTSTFAPTGNILWYVNTVLDHFASQPSPVMAELTQQCQSTLKRTQKNGPRECKPSKLELQHILSQNVSVPNSIQVKMKLPVHLTNGTSVELEFYMSTTVQELVSHLNQEIGMPDVSKTGFALMSDWPGVEDCSLFYLLPTTKLCDIISMWYDSLEELNPVRLRQPRIINLSYRNRLSLQVRSGLESEKEAVLLAYQVNSEVTSGRYLVAKTENVFRMAAYMCQIEYGEWDDSHRNMDTLVRDGLEKFHPKNSLRQTMQQDQVWLQSLLSEEWKSLRGYSRQQCAQKYLQAARSWQFSMSTLMQAEERIFCQTNPRNRAIWLAIQESGVSILDKNTMECMLTHSFKEITTFGSHGDDFMLVVSPQPGTYPVRPDQVIPEAQKYFISMPKLQVREATLLMASYLEVLEQ